MEAFGKRRFGRRTAGHQRPAQPLEMPGHRGNRVPDLDDLIETFVLFHFFGPIGKYAILVDHIPPPENYTASFNLRYGKILSAVTRDNVEIEMTGKVNADGATGTEKSGSTAVTTDGTLKVKIGRQINGAATDLVKAGADPDKVLEALTKTESETK
jgi:hypothetical protein